MGTVTKASAATRADICVDPKRGSTVPLGPQGPCGTASSGSSGPDLSALRVGDRVRYRTFETTSDDEGMITGWLITLPGQD